MIAMLRILTAGHLLVPIGSPQRAGQMRRFDPPCTAIIEIELQCELDLDGALGENALDFV
jgi:hypothetical protein